MLKYCDCNYIDITQCNWIALVTLKRVLIEIPVHYFKSIYYQITHFVYDTPFLNSKFQNFIVFMRCEIPVKIYESLLVDQLKS